MGFFDLKATCAICHKEVGWNRFQIANKEWICPACFKKAGFNALTPIRKMTIDDIKTAMNSQQAKNKELNSFNATKKIGGYLEIDDNKQLWLISKGFLGKKPKVYKYSDIIDFELLEDGETITKGGLGRALAGGILFGGVGAIVGGVTGGKRTKPICNSLKIKITVKDINDPAVYINFIEGKAKKNGIIYKIASESAQECLSTLQLICDSQKSEQNNEATTTSNADEIMKYKNLLDAGAITQEEFEAKKRQLLGL